MPGYIRVWMKMIVDFIFSISVITAIIAYALLGTITSEKLKIIFTESAVSEGNLNILFQGSLPEFVIRNFLWYSLFIIVFCLIILVFMEPKLKVFLFPGSLCFLSAFFVQAALISLNSFISPDSAAATSPFVSQFLKQANLASLVAGGTGMILLIISCLSIYQNRKETTPDNNLQ